MTRTEIQELFTNALKEKLIGTKHSDRRVIEDVSVELSTETDYGNSNDEYNDYYATYETISVKVKTSSPKGRVSTWSPYYY